MKQSISKKLTDRLKGKGYLVRLNTIAKPSYPLHWHEFYEIEICLEGSGVQRLNGTEYPLVPGMVTLLRLTDFHEYSFDAPCSIVNIAFLSGKFSNEYFDSLLKIKDDIVIRFDGQELDKIQTLGKMLLSEYEADSAYKSDSESLIMNYIFIMLLRRTGTPDNNSPVYGNHQLKRAIEYIDLHFREAPSLNEVAAIAGYSKNYFCQIFSEAMGQSYSTYLNRKKINYSKMLLSSTDIPILDICMNSGFNTISNFIHIFSREAGVSPSKYRKQHQDEKC